MKFQRVLGDIGDIDSPAVQTPLGKVVGSYAKSFEGRNISAFEGIPYAKPPVDELRFHVSSIF